MTKKIKRVDARLLQTMEDVHREQLRVGYALHHSEQLLRRDQARVEEVCQPDYWLAILSRKASALVGQATGSLTAQIRRFASGWGIADNLLGNFGLGGGWLGRLFGPRYGVEEEIFFVPEYDSDDEEFLGDTRTC